MEHSDLGKAYEIMIDRFIDAKKDMENNVFYAMFDNIQQSDSGAAKEKSLIAIDEGKVAWFTRCYELTMTYLLAKQDIEMKHSDGGMTHEEQNAAREQIKKIKDTAAMIFNNMKDRDLYFNQPNMIHFRDFWDAFYNGKQCDMGKLARSLEDDIDYARNVFRSYGDIKISSDTLGDACVKYASANEFVKMARLALQVENENIAELKPHIANLEREAKDVQKKQSVETKVTDRGFVTNYAYALMNKKHSKEIGSVERCVLSTPGITNRVAQEMVYSKSLTGRTRMIPQQITFGENRNYEVFVDFVRGFWTGTQTGGQILGDMSKVLAFCLDSNGDPQARKAIEDLAKDIADGIKEKLPHEVLGQSKEQVNLRDVSLEMMILDAKLEAGTISDYELAKHEVMRRSIDAVQETLKGSVKSMMKGKFETTDFVESLASDMQKHGIGIFDNYRYDNLRGATSCDGERGMATIRLITHMMARGEQERQSHPIEYREAMDFLDKAFGKEIDLRQELEEYTRDNNR